MTLSWKFALPLLLTVIGLGCAAPAVNTRPPAAPAAEVNTAPAAALPDAGTELKSLRDQLNATGVELRAAQQQITLLQQRLKDMDARLDAAATSESAAIQEIKESLASRNDRFTGMAPVPGERKSPARPQPKVAGAFKPDGFEVEPAYQNALANYKALKFEDAIRGFTEIITIAPSSSLADNAQYWIGESYYSMKNQEKALESFNRVFFYKNTNKAADARLKIGFTYLMMGNTEEARKQLNRVLTEYPGTNAEKLASARLGTLEKQ